MSGVASVQRGLEILRLVNQQIGLTLAEISKMSGLSRGTVYRMLYTFEAAGLIERADTGYYPTHRVRSLSHGFDDDWAEEVAAPFVTTLGRKILWPVTFSEPSVGSALVRLTTDQDSPFVINPIRVGDRMSLTNSASGRVMLAYTSSERQKVLLNQNRDVHGRGTEAEALMSHRLETTAKVIRERGYDIFPTPCGREMAIAVPVRNGEGVAVAALAFRCFNAAMTHVEALNRFLGPLQEHAQQISDQLSKRQRSIH